MPMGPTRTSGSLRELRKQPGVPISRRPTRCARACAMRGSAAPNTRWPRRHQTLGGLGRSDHDETIRRSRWGTISYRSPRPPGSLSPLPLPADGRGPDGGRHVTPRPLLWYERYRAGNHNGRLFHTPQLGGSGGRGVCAACGTHLTKVPDLSLPSSLPPCPPLPSLPLPPVLPGRCIG